MHKMSFVIFRARMTQYARENATLNAKEKLDHVKLLGVYEAVRVKDRIATKRLKKKHLPGIGRSLYIGRLASPVTVFHPSKAAKIRKQLRLHYLRALNTTAAIIKHYPCTGTYTPTDWKASVCNFQLVDVHAFWLCLKIATVNYSRFSSASIFVSSVPGEMNIIQIHRKCVKKYK